MHAFSPEVKKGYKVARDDAEDPITVVVAAAAVPLILYASKDMSAVVAISYHFMAIIVNNKLYALRKASSALLISLQAPK